MPLGLSEGRPFWREFGDPGCQHRSDAPVGERPEEAGVVISDPRGRGHEGNRVGHHEGWGGTRVHG